MHKISFICPGFSKIVTRGVTISNIRKLRKNHHKLHERIFLDFRRATKISVLFTFGLRNRNVYLYFQQFLLGNFSPLLKLIISKKSLKSGTNISFLCRKIAFFHPNHLLQPPRFLFFIWKCSCFFIFFRIQAQCAYIRK